jgi:uncharacterized protein (TIGR02270 family)
MPRTTAEPFWDLVEESLDEAAFLWKRWEADLDSPTRSLDGVWSWTEDRLQGALDGVRVARQQVVRLARLVFEADDPARLTVCAHLLAARCAAQACEQLADVIREAKGARLWSMIRGIETAELDASFAPVTTVLSSFSPMHLAALCRLKAFRRSLPGQEIAEAFTSGEPLVQVEALRVLRHVRDDSAGKYVAAGLKSDSPAVRKAAMECGVRQRQANAWEAARQLTYERNPESGPFLSLLAALGSAEERQLVIGALREPALQRSGLFALGYIGTPEAVEICLTAMRDPNLARSAGETYCAITGADLQRDRLAAAEPDEEGSSPPEFDTDRLEANLVPAPHQLWPLPDESRVRGHWEACSSRYVRGARHFLGKPVDLGALLAAVESGPMLRRPDVIAELTIRTGGRYDVEARAFAGAQRRMMFAGRGALG